MIAAAAITETTEEVDYLSGDVTSYKSVIMVVPQNDGESEEAFTKKIEAAIEELLSREISDGPYKGCRIHSGDINYDTVEVYNG